MSSLSRTFARQAAHDKGKPRYSAGKLHGKLGGSFLKARARRRKAAKIAGRSRRMNRGF